MSEARPEDTVREALDLAADRRDWQMTEMRVLVSGLTALDALVAERDTLRRAAETAARRLAAGRDDVVGMLALGRSAPEREGYVLTTPMDTGGLTDSDRARREIAIRRSAHKEPGQ
jgi:hypothetical protein